MTAPKPIPMTLIALLLGILFFALMIVFLIAPTFFDVSLFGELHKAGPAPWAMSESENQKYQYTEEQMQGRFHFQQYCASCHGPEGRGNGPSSITLTRRPKSFLLPNSGFKNGLTKEGVLKTLNEGIPGSQMPSFRQLPENVREALGAYVEYLNQHPLLF